MNTELGVILQIRERTRYSIGFLIVGILLLLSTAYIYLDNPLTKNDLTVVTGHLQEEIGLSSDRKRKSIEIRLTEYDAFTFRFGTRALVKKYYGDLTKDFDKGDLIHLTIEKLEYEKKISKVQPLTLWDQIYFYNHISLIEIAGNNRTYLSLQDINELEESNRPFVSLILGIMALGFTTIGVQIFRRRKILDVPPKHKKQK